MNELAVEPDATAKPAIPAQPDPIARSHAWWRPDEIDQGTVARELLAQASRAQVLATLSKLLAGADLDIDEMCRAVVGLTSELMNAGVVLRLHDGDAANSCFTHHPDPAQAAELTALAAARPATGTRYDRAAMGETVVRTDGVATYGFDADDPASHSAVEHAAAGPADSEVIVPLLAGNDVLGTLLATRVNQAFSAAEVSFLQEIGSRAGLALANAYLLVDLRSALRRQQELLREIDRIAREEQRRVAVDLHDDAVQVISAALMRLGTLRLLVDDPVHQQAIAETEAAVAASVSRLRSMMFQLSPSDLQTIGLRRALDRLCADVLEGTATKVTLEMPDLRLPQAVSETLFRIIREALVNVRKHASATEVTIHLSVDETTLSCRVSDNGPGPVRPPESNSFGLRSMVDRAEAAGGRVSFSREGSHTVLEVMLPRHGQPGASASVHGSAIGSGSRVGRASTVEAPLGGHVS